MRIMSSIFFENSKKMAFFQPRHRVLGKSVRTDLFFGILIVMLLGRRGVAGVF